jgi:hypothetical protein
MHINDILQKIKESSSNDNEWYFEQNPRKQ